MNRHDAGNAGSLVGQKRGENIHDKRGKCAEVSKMPVTERQAVHGEVAILAEEDRDENDGENHAEETVVEIGPDASSWRYLAT